MPFGGVQLGRLRLPLLRFSPGVRIPRAVHGNYMNSRLGDCVTDLPMALDFDDFAWWSLAARVP